MKISRVYDVILISVYKCVLDITFLFCVQNGYGYQAQFHVYGDKTGWRLLCSYLISFAGLVAFWLLKESARISRFLIFMQIILVLVPFSTLYWAEHIPMWQMGVMATGFFSMIFFTKVIPVPHMPLPNGIIRFSLISLMIIILVYVYFGLIVTGGLGRFNFNLFDVYSVRAEYVDSKLPLFGYFVPWTAYIFNMALLVYFIIIRGRSVSKSNLGILFVLCMQLLLFGMTNYKSYLFTPFTVFGLVWLARRMEIQRAVLIGVPIVVGLMLLINFFGLDIGGALVTRLFFTPAALHSVFFDYFSTHPFALLSDTLGDLLGSKYNEPIIHIIAERYWGRIFAPNVGWIGDAYANFGLGGVALYGAVLAFFLRLTDGFVNESVPKGLVEGLLVGIVFALISSAIGTVMLTHGFLILLIALWVLKYYWGSNTPNVA